MKNTELRYEVQRIKAGESALRTEMMVLYIIEGSMKIRVMNVLTEMNAEDILLIQPGMEYTVEEAKKCIAGYACYTAELAHRLFRGQDLQLFCNSTVDHRNSYQDLREIFRKLTAEYTEQNMLTDCYSESQLLLLLNTIAEHYHLNPNHAVHDMEANDERMQKLMQYTMAHLYEDMSLSEIADELYVSTSTLSRLFRKKMGTYFADYVSHLRVQRSLELLEFSDQSLTQIAMECGFSNSGNYSRIFRKEIGMTPSAYREQQRAKREETLLKQREEEEQIRKELEEKGHGEVSSDVRRKEELKEGELLDISCKPIWNQAVNIGPLTDLTKANVQFHILHLEEQLHFSHVRIWNIFSKEMMITDGKSMGPYNYDLVDQALDFLIEHHLKPFMDFGRRPNMALNSQGDSVFYNEEYISFAAKENWEDLIHDFIGHLIQRYGAAEVSEWIFELSGSDVYSNGKTSLYPGGRFIDAYSFVYAELKHRLPEVLFGGIGAENETDREVVDQFLDECQKREILPDYLSFIMFPYQSQNLGERSQMEEIEGLMKARGLREQGVKLFITEWNPLISNRSYLNDSCFRSAYLASHLSAFLGKADMLVLMSGTDWVSNYIDSVGIVNGGIGILTKDMIKKPAFYALEFFNQLGNTIIHESKNTIVTTRKNGEIVALCFYAEDFRRNGYLSGKDVDLNAYRTAVCSDEQPLHLDFLFSHVLEEGTYVVKHRTLNRNHGSILDEWSRFSYDKHLGRTEIKYLETTSTPVLSQERIQVRGHQQVHLELVMKPQEVTLLYIQKQ